MASRTCSCVRPVPCASTVPIAYDARVTVVLGRSVRCTVLVQRMLGITKLWTHDRPTSARPAPDTVAHQCLVVPAKLTHPGTAVQHQPYRTPRLVRVCAPPSTLAADECTRSGAAHISASAGSTNKQRPITTAAADEPWNDISARPASSSRLSSLLRYSTT